ncbi:GtrA family protein [Variovorax guangxiensis]|uniref:GtrA family protein n=1 Tax=Variovorax guangxiensis TaxID=1775474 RepID=UPI00286217C1|nr:GtrA family protein [Variovorax guangxiensis]MDR6857579.1 putative flippase GtrA [Variovorax guangxiensis]
MKQLLRFAAVGVVNTGLGYAVIFACMYLAGLDAVASNVFGYAVGLVASYVLNRTYTFRSAAAAPGEIVRFVSIFLLAYLANLGALLLLIHRVGMHEGGAQLLAGVVYFGLSFMLNKYYVFAVNRAGTAGR